MTWAIIKKPELAVVSMYDIRTDTRTEPERFRDFAKEAGIHENDASLVRPLEGTGSNGEMESRNDDGGMVGDCVYGVRTGGCVCGDR